MLTYSNPRLLAEFNDWPYGAEFTRCVFRVEAHPRKGERVVRVTTDPKTGRETTPKALTFAVKARIVDGSNGKTYLAMLTVFGHVSIARSDMKFSHESVHEGDERYAAVRALFN